jgi:ketosteroid isomerase-like protein
MYFIDSSLLVGSVIRRLSKVRRTGDSRIDIKPWSISRDDLFNRWPVAHLDHIRSYYEALNTGDAELVASHFTDDAVHYYTRLGPHEGAERIGKNTEMGVGMIDGQWYLEHGIEQGDEAVIEWTMTWRDPKSGEKRLDRGTEWFQMRDGKIAEVRAYHHGGKKNPQGDLLGFDHKGRGYTMLEDWKAPS